MSTKRALHHRFLSLLVVIRMKRFMLALSLGSLVLLLAFLGLSAPGRLTGKVAIADTSVNFVPNPSFEDGTTSPDSWDPCGDNTLWDSSIAHTGSRSARNPRCLWKSSPFYLPAGSYYFGFWHLETNTVQYVGAWLGPAGGPYWTFADYAYGDGGWHYFEAYVQINYSYSDMRVWLMGSSDSAGVNFGPAGTVWYDDIYLGTIPNPPLTRTPTPTGTTPPTPTPTRTPTRTPTGTVIATWTPTKTATPTPTPQAAGTIWQCYGSTCSGYGKYLLSISFGSRCDGWAVGKGGTILHGNGVKWEAVPSPTSKYIQSVAALANGEAWAVGEDGTILHYANGSWQLAQSPTTKYLGGATMISPDEGWAVGEDGTILHYTNGSWQSVESPTTAFLSAVTMLNPSEGWAVGGTWDQSAVVLHYLNGAWQVQYQETQGAMLWQISMLSRSEGWAVGEDGLILRYTGGQWERDSSPTTAFLSGISMGSPVEGWAVGRQDPSLEGVILHYKDGSWVNAPSPTIHPLRSIVMFDENHGWAVGGVGTDGDGVILQYGNAPGSGTSNSGLCIEINQGLGWQYNDARKFVAGKDTAIRVFLPRPVPVNPSTQQVVVRRSGSTPALLAPLVTAPITNLTFLCPGQGPCKQAGDYTFEVTVNGVSAQTTATFQSTRTLRVLAVRVKVNDRGQVKQPSEDQLMNAGEFLRQVYPLANDGLVWDSRSELDATGYDLTTEGDCPKIGQYPIYAGCTGRRGLWADLRRRNLLCGIPFMAIPQKLL